MNRIFQALAKIPDGSRALTLVISFAVILMGAVLFARWNADLNFDGEVYISAARKYAAGLHDEGLSIFYTMPLYPYLISLIYRIIPDWVLAGRLISYASMTLVVIPIYLLSRDLFDRRVAFTSCIAFVLLPETLLHSNSVIREPLYFFFLMWSVYLSQKAIQSRQLVHLSIAVLFAWVSAFFRIEGLIIIPVYLCFLIMLTIFKREHRKDYCRLLIIWVSLFACLIGATLMVMGPRSMALSRYHEWVSISQRILDQTFLENYNQVYAHLQQMQETSLNRDVGQNFASTAKNLIGIIYFLGTLQIFIKVILPVNVIPLICGFVRKHYSTGQIYLMSLIGCNLLILCLLFIWRDQIMTRYLFITAILAIPWIGSGIVKIIEFAFSRTHGKIITIVLILVFLITPAFEFDKYFTKRDDLKLQAGKWIANHESLRNLKIIYSDPGVAFHTGKEISFHRDGDTMLYQDADDKNFLKIALMALEKNADVIVIYTRVDRQNDIAYFKNYKEIKIFSDKNKIIKIYGSINLLPSLENLGK